MAEQVGLARYFNLEWLDAVADCKMADNTKEEAHAYLDEIIGQKISSKDNIRKTRTIMLNLWYNNDPWFVEECTNICKGNSDKPHQMRPVLPALSNGNGEGDGTPLQCSCLENPMDGGAW